VQLKKITYSLDQDDRIFLRKKLFLGKRLVKISLCTVAGTKDGVSRKPNEDAVSVLVRNNKLFAAVFDGTSSQKPIPDLKEVTGARFASHFLKEQFELEQMGTLPAEIIRNLNKALLSKSLQFGGTSLTDPASLPASTATIVELDPEQNILQVSHVGDSFCILFYKNGHSEFVTVDRNRLYDEHTLGLMQSIAKKSKITPREARKDERVSQEVARMFQDSHNKADGTGQGVIDGNPNAEQYIQDISLSLDLVSAILLGSDGLLPPGWDEQTERDRQKMLQAIRQGGLENLIQVKQQMEDNDPDWHFLRYKHSDDASAILIEL